MEVVKSSQQLEKIQRKGWLRSNWHTVLPGNTIIPILLYVNNVFKMDNLLISLLGEHKRCKYGYYGDWTRV